MFELRSLVLALVWMLATGLPALAQGSGSGTWVLLATRDVDLAGGTETVDVSASGLHLKAIRLQNVGEPIDISRIRVVYVDNSFHLEDRHINLLRNDRTRPVDPRASGKAVQSVVLTFKPVPGARRTARIAVYGLVDDATPGVTRSKPAASAAVTPAKPGLPTPPAPAAASSAPTAAPAAPAAPAPRSVETRPLRSEPIPSASRCLGRGHLLVSSASLDPATGRAVIRAGARLGQFASLKLCVLGEDVQVSSIRVNYEDASHDDLPFAGVVRASHRSEPMAIRGDRFVQSVDLSYAPRPGTAAEVEVWGELAEDFLDTRARLHEDGWMPLVSLAPARFIGFTVDKEEPGRHREGFSKVRIFARDRDISADYVTLKFADGSEQRFELKRVRIENGKPSSPLQIDGGRKVIVGIEARYRSRFFDPDARGRDKALVEVWGHR